MLSMLVRFWKSSLDRRYAIAKTECDSLCLGADANVSGKLAIVVILLFNRDIDESVFSKHTVDKCNTRSEMECFDNMIPSLKLYIS
jgi:hypothetical protein